MLAREDAPGDKRLVAYITLDGALQVAHGADQPDDDEASVIGEIRQALQRMLPDYMIPSAFVRLDTLPLTSNGKLDRRALPAPDHARLDTQAAFIAPRTPLEEQIAAVWADLLRVERVGVHDNFFALGGHSLLATQALSRLSRTYNAELTLRDFFAASTIAEFAPLVEQRRQEPSRRQNMTITRTQRGRPSALLDKLDQLSDADVDALLNVIRERNEVRQ